MVLSLHSCKNSDSDSDVKEFSIRITGPPAGLGNPPLPRDLFAATNRASVPGGTVNLNSGNLSVKRGVADAGSMAPSRYSPTTRSPLRPDVRRDSEFRIRLDANIDSLAVFTKAGPLRGDEKCVEVLFHRMWFRVSFDPTQRGGSSGNAAGVVAGDLKPHSPPRWVGPNELSTPPRWVGSNELSAPPRWVGSNESSRRMGQW